MKRNIVSLIILFILVMSIDSCAENVSNIENQDTYGAKASKERIVKNLSKVRATDVVLMHINHRNLK